MSLNTTPRTWVTGEVVTAAMMNTEIRDAISGVEAAWTAFTPAWTATTTNPTIGNGTLEGRWSRLGKTALIWLRVTMGSTTTFGTGTYSLSLPSGAVLLSVRGGSLYGSTLDASAGNHYATGGLGNSTTLVNLVNMGTSAQTLFSPTVPVTFAVSDVIMLNGTVEIA